MQNAAVRDRGKTRSATVRHIGTVQPVLECQHDVVACSRRPSQRSRNQHVTADSCSPKSLTESTSLICLWLETVPTQYNGEVKTAVLNLAQYVEAVESHRCSIERLTETKRISKESVMLAQTETERLACGKPISETVMMSARPHPHIAPAASPSPMKLGCTSQSLSVHGLSVLHDKAQEQPIMAPLLSKGCLSVRHSVHQMDVSTRRILCVARCSPVRIVRSWRT